MHAPSALRGIVAGRNNMTAKKAVVRRAAGAALALVLALAVVGPVAAARGETERRQRRRRICGSRA
jgi:hypothetical protein